MKKFPRHLMPGIYSWPILSDVKSAIRFYIESFGKAVLDVEPPILEAFIAEAGIEV